MTHLDFSLEEVGPGQLTEPNDALTEDELETLWFTVGAIETAWELTPFAQGLRRQWDDMIEARSRDPQSYLPEYKNAARVLEELKALDPVEFGDLLFFKTIMRKPFDVKTRLDHAKYYVVNDFIRFLILSGGFKQFGARNYNGFMGGSRFADGPPVRTGDRL